MKIAIASSGLGHISRGIETWAADLAAALHQRGEAVILCKGGGQVAADYERLISCVQRDSPRAKSILRWMPKKLTWHIGMAEAYQLEQTSFARNLIPVLRRERVDILHVQDQWLALHIQRARKFGLVKARSILGHGTEESLKFIAKIDYLQHLAPWHLEQAKAAGVWKPTWTAIPNFIDTDRFNPAGGNLREELGIPREATVVLCVAAIKRHHKRIDYLLDEFCALRQARPELPAWLVVAGGWEKETDELIADGQRRLGERVRFLVKFPRARIADLYRSADIFVLASLMEMMPIALLEATASGLPCLVNRHPVLEWMIGPGGESIDMGASGSLAGALGALSRDRMIELGKRAREHSVGHFSTDRVVDQILDYYRRVMTPEAAR